MRVIVGVDIGGTNLVVGTVTEDGGHIAGLDQRKTPATEGPDAVVGRVTDMIKKSIDGASKTFKGMEVIGIGVGCPGPIDTATGVVRVSPNLGWHEMPLRDRIHDAFQLPVTVDNDASCAILGECWRGAARGARFVIGLTVGTGIGGGIVIDGKIFHGASDVAGEFGHMTIDSTGRRCSCGNYGCLEAYASGPAIAARAREGIKVGAESRMSQYVDGNIENITAQTVYQAANDGDELAQEVVRDTARFLGAGIASLINIFNPELVVMCGGVTAAGEGLFRPIRQEVMRRAFAPAAEACRIVPGTLPGTAGVYGAVAVFNQTMNP